MFPLHIRIHKHTVLHLLRDDLRRIRVLALPQVPFAARMRMSDIRAAFPGERGEPTVRECSRAAQGKGRWRKDDDVNVSGFDKSQEAVFHRRSTRDVVRSAKAEALGEALNCGIVGICVVPIVSEFDSGLEVAGCVPCQR